MKKDLISISDLTIDDINGIFELTKHLKSGKVNKKLTGKTIAMIFEKPSLRTRVTFEAGMSQLDGQAIYLTQNDIQLRGRESVADAAKNLERWVDGIVARTYEHETIMELASNCRVPVINALSNLEHPCQALTDFFTILEKKSSIQDIKIAYVGDANNVCNSLALLASLIGAHFAVGSPKKYQPDEGILKKVSENARESNAEIQILENPADAVKDADVVYTDVWISMGDESESEQRLKAFQSYQVNEKLLANANKDVIVMHCLPAKRGMEITSEVLDGPYSIVFDQAENRLHVQKTILLTLLGNHEDKQIGLFSKK